MIGWMGCLRTRTTRAVPLVITQAIESNLWCVSIWSLGTVNQIQSLAQSTTQSFAADHIALSFGFTMMAGKVIETHEYAGEFKEP